MKRIVLFQFKQLFRQALPFLILSACPLLTFGQIIVSKGVEQDSRQTSQQVVQAYQAESGKPLTMLPSCTQTSFQFSSSDITPEPKLMEPKSLTPFAVNHSEHTSPAIQPVRFNAETQASPQWSEPSLPQQANLPQPVVGKVVPLVSSGFVTKNHKLQHVASEHFERKFFECLGKRFVPVQNIGSSGNLARFRMPVNDGTDLDLSIDRKNNIATIVGSPDMVESTLQIIRLLDAPLDVNSTTEIMSVQKTNLLPLKKAVSIVNQTTNQEARKPTIAQGTPKAAQNTPTFQGEQPTARFSRPNQTQNGSDALAQNMSETGGSIVGPVQIDIIDGLDTMVIKGNPKDVAAIQNMIRQIESMSLEHEPIIELVDVKHTDSYRISQMVQQLYSQVYSARKGNVTMLPLIKPNTILLAGKQESIDTAKELIAKLDKEVAPDSEFLIIRLKNASSDTLQTQITQFYSNRTVSGQGLETQVTIASDSRTNSLIVQGSPRDLTEVAAMVRQLDAPGSDALNMVKTFPLKNSMASELATTLQNAISGTSTGQGGFGNAASSAQSSRTRSPMLTMNTLDEEGNLQRASVLLDVRIVADTRSNTLIVTAPTESMPLIEALVKQLDQLPSAESQIKVFTLVNGDASTLTTVLTNLFATSSTSGGGFGGGTSSQTSQIATVRPGIEEGESTLVSVRFQNDVRTNSIIACGSAGDMAVVEAILLRLDEENMNNRKVMIFKPFNNRASDIATAIQNYMTQERQLEIQNSSTYYPQSPQEQYRKEVTAVYEDVTNTLIVSATPRYFEQVRRIVAELDERPLMVSIQVLIAEVSLNNDCERGVELGLQDSILFDRSIDGVPGFLFGDPKQGLPLGNVNSDKVGSQGITSLGVGRSNSSGIGGFTFSASSESVSILIRALEEKNRARILSRPHLTVMHEQVGSISVGQRVPYPKDVSVNDNTVTTSVDFYEVGTILDIIPRIMPDGVIALGVHAERSNVAETGGITIASSDGVPIVSPRVNQAIAETTIHARDGQTIVFAGLITEHKEMLERSVPLLNRIPVVKNLFQYKSISRERTELLIILTPTIIRSDMDVEVLKQQEAARMHWCINDVVKLTGDSSMRIRTDEWSPCDAPFVRAEAVILDESQLPSEDKVRMMYPTPMLVPDGEQ